MWLWVKELQGVNPVGGVGRRRVREGKHTLLGGREKMDQLMVRSKL